MVKTKRDIEKIIQKYIKILQGIFFVNEVYLFGSYARSQANRYSDIDIAVISKDFQYMHEFIALKILARLSRRVDPSIEALAITPKDLKNAPLGTIEYTIRHHGKRVFPAFAQDEGEPGEILELHSKSKITQKMKSKRGTLRNSNRVML
jgi:predicted nucleotidyltransferase